ncbi:hypothetical protein VCR15J5_610265 [Vibrio crassostreae]|nr:hypothetical protein VCR9J2_220009 [Vibrio crassostreae]CDT44706.1 hypothetical protein VCR15J5_610265 [Vibrio crassostreae]
MSSSLLPYSKNVIYTHIESQMMTKYLHSNRTLLINESK